MPPPPTGVEGWRAVFGGRGRVLGRSFSRLHVLVRVVVLHVPLLHSCDCLGTWYLLGDCCDDPCCRVSVLQGPLIEACRDDSPSLGFSFSSLKYRSLSRRSLSRGFSSLSFKY